MKSNEKTRLVNKVNDGGRGRGEERKTACIQLLEIFKTPFDSTRHTAVFSVVTQRSSPQTAVCG